MIFEDIAPKVTTCIVEPTSKSQQDTTITSPSTLTASSHDAESELTLTDEEREAYVELFKLQKPINGLLEGERARAFLMESGLPIEMLGRIW
jgi:hypothetical protein